MSFEKLADLLHLEKTEFPGQDCAAFVGVLITGIVWFKLGRFLTDRQIFTKTVTRKLVHLTSAPIYLLCWLFFSSTNEARYFAAAVPVINLCRSLLTGFGVCHDRDLVTSMSRDGSSQELLLGPTFYALTMIGITICFWRSSWVSFLTVGILAGGDGMAEIIGKRFGKHKLPFNERKSIEGSLAMIGFGFLLSIGLMEVFHGVGFLPLLWNGKQVPYFWTLFVCVFCAFVESLPTDSKVDDNISVPLTSILLGLFIERFE